MQDETIYKNYIKKRTYLKFWQPIPKCEKGALKNVLHLFELWGKSENVKKEENMLYPFSLASLRRRLLKLYKVCDNVFNFAVNLEILNTVSALGI